MKENEKKAEDCVFLKDGECRALNETKCKNCVFYKTEFEHKIGRQRALLRIASLSKEEQAHIIAKYYNMTDGEIVVAKN